MDSQREAVCESGWGAGCEHAASQHGALKARSSSSVRLTLTVTTLPPPACVVHTGDAAWGTSQASCPLLPPDVGAAATAEHQQQQQQQQQHECVEQPQQELQEPGAAQHTPRRRSRRRSHSASDPAPSQPKRPRTPALTALALALAWGAATSLLPPAAQAQFLPCPCLPWASSTTGLCASPDTSLVLLSSSAVSATLYACAPRPAYEPRWGALQLTTCWNTSCLPASFRSGIVTTTLLNFTSSLAS